MHEPEEKTPNDGHNDRCPQCRDIASCWVTNINNITLKLNFRQKSRTEINIISTSQITENQEVTHDQN